MLDLLITTVRNIRTRADREDGATAVEYGLMVALIAVIIVVAVATLGNTVDDTFTDANDCITDPTANGCP